jgi:hypothetical protein
MILALLIDFVAFGLRVAGRTAMCSYSKFSTLNRCFDVMLQVISMPAMYTAMGQSQSSVI